MLLCCQGGLESGHHYEVSIQLVVNVCLGSARLSRQQLPLISNWRLLRNCCSWLQGFWRHFALARGINDAEVNDEKNNEWNDGFTLKHGPFLLIRQTFAETLDCKF